MFKIPDYVLNVLNILNNAGYASYLAGGCVRDFLMDKTPADYDIATSAEPLETKNCFSDIYHVVETGIKHGTVTVVTEGGNIEVTTFRTDGEYKDGRHPEKVSFSKNINDDLCRRDFTINAMAYNHKSGIIDLFSGQKHIKEKIIACVGDADTRFKEDALRILRGLRFASVLGFSIEDKTSESILKNKGLLKNISKERIFVEFKKLLSGECTSEILIKYKSVITEFIPEFSQISDDAYNSLCLKLDRLPKNVNLRLSLFLSAFSADMAGAILRSLKSDNKTVYFVKNTVKGLNTKITADKVTVKHFLKENSQQIMDAVLKIKSNAEAFSIFEEIIKNDECYSLKQLAVNGKDIVKILGVSGEATGKILDCLLEKVITGETENSKKCLTELIKNNLL